MKKLITSCLSALLLVTGCTSSANKDKDETKKPEAIDIREENNDPENIESVEIEEETEIEAEEGESSGGM